MNNADRENPKPGLPELIIEAKRTEAVILMKTVSAK